jgi:RHS repeat-associated protein
VTSTYDKEDRLISLNDTAPGAGPHNFTYDQLDRLTQETNFRGKVNYTYDVLGRRTSLKVNNQRTLNYSYDDNDRLTAITEGSETFGFNYDALDRRVGMTLPNGVSTAYNYDAAGRLTGMKYSKGSTVLRDLVYGYDEINRRTSYSGNTAPEPQETATTNATVDASNRYTSLNGKSISHDENGNQKINNAVWDARDRLVSLSGPGFTASFTYDVMGRRTSKTVNGQTKTYLYDGDDLISETGADYTFGPGIDQPLERKTGQNEYYLSDALGSVIGLTDPTGTIKTSYNYSPFGKKQTTGTASDNPFAFTGREDDSNGYYFYRGRYYSPDQKRFISEDPLGFGGGDSNLQAYVGNNPISLTDPSGEIGLPLLGGAAAGALLDGGWQLYRNGGRFDCIHWGEVGLAAAGGATLAVAFTGLGALGLAATEGGEGTLGLGAAAEGLAGVPGRVSSRINLSNEGMEHVIKRHLSGKANASQFSLSESELRSVLSSRAAVSSPVVRAVNSKEGIQYIREFDAGRVIGTDKFSGNQATSVMTIMTDTFGNLKSAFPGLLK